MRRLKGFLVAAFGAAMAALIVGCNLSSVSDEGIVAVIRAEPTSGESPLEVSFDGTGSRDPAGEIQEYLWDFGDGSGVGEGPTVTHVYTRPGTYTATLVVTGPSGVGRATAFVYVDNSPPQADFTHSPQDPLKHESIVFDASASVDPDGEIVAYYWDFGDGATAEGEVVSHAYEEDGQYLVILRVVDDGGAEDETSRQVVVETCPGGVCG